MGKKNNASKASAGEFKRIALIPRITLIYFLMLAGLIFLTLRANIPVYETAGSQTPETWLYLLWFFYYVLPWGLAVLMGLALKPFWPHFRNLLVTILVIQGAYSVGVVLWRDSYLEKKEEVAHTTNLAHLRVSGFRNELKDLNNDGIIDDVELLMHCDMKEYPLGRYILRALITQKGREFPDSDIGTYSITLEENKPKDFTANFRLNPQIFQPYFENGDFEANLLVQGMMPVDEKGTRVLKYSRWSPFLRYANWQGENDPDISSQTINLEKISRVGSFRILPLDLTRSQVIFKRYAGDFGKDLDGDGLYEQLVIVIELLSKYEGPVYLQALIKGAPYPIFYESSLTIGLNRLEFNISAKAIRETGADGPYEVSELQLFNKNPGCQTDECLKRLKPFFTVPLDNYVTKKYSLTQLK